MTDGAARWRGARTFAELCELGAQFLEGSIAESPWHAAPVDEETAPLVTELARFNRAGFLTECSQPGLETNDTAQRAYVSGYAQESLARLLYRLTLCTDLIVLVTPPGEERFCQIPVTRDLHPATWGGAMGPEIVEQHAAACGPAAARELRRAWHLEIIDPQWGRVRYLWDHVSAVLSPEGHPDPRWPRLSERPTPDLGLDSDFVC